MNVRKMRQLEVSCESLLPSLGPIPKDAQIVQINKQGEGKVAILLFSEEFPEFEGSIVPALVPTEPAAAPTEQAAVPSEQATPSEPPPAT